MTIAWPSILVPQRASPELRNLTRSGGRVSGGREQRVLGDAGFWAVTVSGIYIRNRAAAMAYRAMIARLREGEDILVPLFDVFVPLGAEASNSAAALVSAATLRATTVTIRSTGIEIVEGSFFSADNRLHVVTEVTSAPPSPPFQNRLVNDEPWNDDQPWTDSYTASGFYTVKITPPLRTNYPAGQPLLFAGVQLRCVIDRTTDGDLDIEPAGIGFADLNFVESN